MTIRRSIPASGLLSALLLALAASASASAQPPATVQAQRTGAAGIADTGSPKERGNLVREFVSKWGYYVQRVYKVPVGTWSMRMVPNFAHADINNLRNATKRATFEGAMAELNGSGHRLSDAQAARGAAKLGDLGQDLVYTPVQPCRIVDTRNTAAGAIPASGSRDFVALNQSSYATQGGSATDCGTLGVNATAVALNVTAVGYTASGHAIVYPYGTTIPVTSSINFNLANFATNNGIIAKIPNPVAANDFTIWTVQSSHFVVDIVGYFAPPLATPLDCTATSVSSFTINTGAMAFFNNPACPAGYKAVTPYCWTASAGVYSQGSGYNANTATNNTFCSWQNTTAANQTVFGGNVCCRVPGR